MPTDFDLPPGTEQTYGQIIDKQLVSDKAPGLRELQAIGLVAAHPVKAGRYVALDAQLAIRRHMTAEQEVLHRTAQRMASLSSLDRLAARHDQARYWGGPASEYLPTGDLVAARISESISRATTEVLTGQPGYRRKVIIDSVMQRDVNLLERGVSMQILYHASTRTNPNVKAYTTEIQAAGAEIRVLHGPFSHIILIDSREAFIRNVASGDGNDASGWRITDMASVMFMREAYLTDWMRAEAWNAGSQEPQGWLSQRQQEILRLMDAGYDQTRVATKLGITSRTVAQHLATLRDQLGLDTTMQVMIWYGRQQQKQEN
ncbi:LuxR C-terminal-related transcriptional regulator [Streptomyces sp. SBC-4]|nr:LuxR C-terminal-related transcriptional regulator [Streptomyces sp. SBC-4]MDV5145870.1 LuxR C-terminal-related transcriptional regulator [Streptomyces sp. SBC-4]